MIVPIIIQTEDILSQFTSLTKEDVDKMLDNVAKGLAARYAEKVEQLAEQELKTTRRRYIQNIKVVDSGKMEGTVLLDYSKDRLIKMIEEGSPPFDMKPDMLNSPKAKTSKKGTRYITIPFRVATPGAIGESEVFAGKMPSPIYQIAKNKPLIKDTPGGGKRSAGISLKEIPEQFQLKKTRAAIADNKGNALFESYQHKNSIYEGIIKQQDATTGQNTYRSFRRVSENSDENAWIHPGIEKHALIMRSLGNFNTADEMSLLIDEEFSKKGLI